MTEPQPNELELEELHTRLVYAFLQASASLSSVFGLGLKTFERLSHMAAFHVLRKKNFDLNQIAEHLQVSRRKVDLLSRSLKDNFFEQFVGPEDSESLQRRIEFMLWAEPMSVARLKQVLPMVENVDIEDALAMLTDAQRIRLSDGRYSITTKQRRLVRDTWLAKLGGLNHQLNAVTNSAVGSFIHKDGIAQARTASLRVKRDQVKRLEELYSQHIWPTLVELDAECGDLTEDDYLPLTFSVCWAEVSEMNPIKK